MSVSVYSNVVLFLRCDMGGNEEYESVNFFTSYELYELIVGLLLPGHHIIDYNNKI